VGGGGIAALLSFVFMACLSIIGIALFSVATRPGNYAPPAPAPTYFENGPADAPSAPPAVEHGRRHLWLHRWNDPPTYRHTWDAPGVDRYPTRTDRP